MRFIKKIDKRIQDNSGFMGHTHAISALAVFLLLIALVPSIVFERILQTENILILVSSFFVVTGAALIPDFDNTKSTAISTLGIVGQGISKFMRATAVVIYHLVHSRQDDPEPNPHRGFWHTLAAGILIGVIVYLTTKLTITTNIPIINKQVPIGFLSALLWIYICTKMALAGIFGKLTKKIKQENIIFKIVYEIIVLLFVLLVLVYSPANVKYTWIAYTMSLGYCIHILGDTLTVAGTPLLWPLKHKGKRWWTYRFIGVKAGGLAESMIFLPMFSVIIILSLIKIFGYLK